MGKIDYKYLSAWILGVSIFTSCTTEAPFENEKEGSVSFLTRIYSDVELVSRAEGNIKSLSELENDLVIYVENEKGVIRRYIGKDNLPENLVLSPGEYAIEGWTGDSVSASYTEKFFRGYQKFTVEPGVSTEVDFDVNIANVIVSIDKETLKQDFDDFKVTFSHSKGDLSFDRTSTEEGKKGYFMMPSTDTALHYKVELKNELGEDLIKEGDIKNVERAHEYSIKILTENQANDKGAGMIKLEIYDIPVVEKNLNVYPAPIYYAQLGADLEEFDVLNTQIDFSEGNFSDLRLRIVGYGSLSRLALNFPEPFEGMEEVNGVNLRNSGSAKDNAVALLVQKNISYGAESEGNVFDHAGKTHYQECWITFSADFFRDLAPSDKEYIIEVEATDGMENPASSSLKIRIANSENAVDKRLIESIAAPDTYDSSNPMGILAHSAELKFIVRDNNLNEYGIEYRKKDSSDSFERVKYSASLSAGQTGTLTLTSLDPDTEYEYRAYSDQYTEQNPKSFKTEGRFDIPNKSMEYWITLSKSPTTNANNVPVPSLGTTVEFWDNGNHGSRSVSGMATTLTEGSEDMANSGTKSAKLTSKFVGLTSSLGKFAAGNLFIGYFARVDGTDGVLQLGREYNQSHPSSLDVYVNYQPGIVANNVADGTHLTAGSRDVGHIYVALTVGAFEVRTKNQEKLFDAEDPQVIAYGDITMDTQIGSGKTMVLKNIELKYKEEAKTQSPTHLIVVCAASKYGDYFVGGEGSTMYVDDFELQYGDIKWWNE